MSYKKISNYLLIKEIDKREGKDVYLGLDTLNNSLVSIKLVPSSTLENIQSLQSFKQALHIHNAMEHNNILKLITQEKTKNNIYLILEYPNGGNLREYLNYYKKNNNKPLPEEMVQKIIRQISNGLEYIHSKNVIHRNIRLETIYINYDDKTKEVNRTNPINVSTLIMSLDGKFTVKIGDFEFSKELLNDSGTRSICFTPLTVAPDIFVNKNEKGYNKSVDLWSLGTITYELIIGEPPFNGTSLKEVFEEISKGKYVYPNNIDISIECISFINGLLQFDPNKRMKWEDIKKHPFLTGDMKNFKKINIGVNSYNGNLKEFEMDSKNCNNFLWVIYKDNNKIGIDLDKINYDWINKDINMNYCDKKLSKHENEEGNKSKSEDWEVVTYKTLGFDSNNTLHKNNKQDNGFYFL